ncbi:alpha-mannosidase 2 [Thrips palmi]|uniref:Alpha-mannosidase n=1 Tax=Thrips palmi TaxID=161013 RepID=A0A6P8ZXB0_THRPL|nr:alpha-mannosidase 2 [Thrips palmi]XP_034249441.1 alpha-mannosidase 2 [Thrips palmi]
MRVRVRRKAALVASALFLGCCFVIYLIIEMTMLPHHDDPTSPQSEQYLRVGENYKTVDRSVDNIYHAPHNVSFALQSAHWSPQLENCPALSTPNADIQMYEMYNQLKFDNIDGGVWKQGWNIGYSADQWTSRRKLRIFVVPHSHNDPGWLKTFEDYYQSQTKHILNNMVTKLYEDSKRKFIWAEISFFAMWWEGTSEEQRVKVKRFVQSGQLEFVTGGWVMNDEANTHYFNMLTQLTEGHLWLLKNLGVTPKNSWSIDPFGLSSSMAFLVQRAGMQNMLIQRVHYSVKKALAKNRQLEFRWRQPWDTAGTLDIFTHMMPFYSYDVPHTCGPDPKICCQFDFKRLPGYGLSCPWKAPPKIITKGNVAERAELLLDQYSKKAQLYQTNVLLVPLGDDFRYDHLSEWDHQFDNYQKIFDHLNSKPKYHVEAKFGTLDDYFQAVREERSQSGFPSLTGDFFTYADRDDHYWSGYYTSRPFYKRMDRLAMNYLRSAEMIFTLAWSEQLQTNIPAVNSVHSWLLTPRSALLQRLEEARRQISLFQHHDGITGTAKDFVVEDYARKLYHSILGCQHVIQMSAYALLAPRNEQAVPETDTVFFNVDDVWQDHHSLPDRVSVTLGAHLEVDSRRIVVFNSLSWKRQEVVYLQVSTPHVKITDHSGNVIKSQTSPIFQPAGISESSFEVAFITDLKPLSITTYTVSLSEPNDKFGNNHFASVRIMNAMNQVRNVNDIFKSKLEPDSREFKVRNDKVSVAFNSYGLLKAVTDHTTDHTSPVHLDFAKYGARLGSERSGAYLFLPDKEAQVLSLDRPLIKVIEGPIYNRVEVDLPGVVHSVTLLNSPGVDSAGLEIINKIDITQFANFEMVMRVSSNVRSQDEFFTDLNGLQIVKRKRLAQLPLQGNYYPLPSQIFIQDEQMRLTLLSSQPLGTASLKEGQIEVMQDRKLMQDDNRGLGQGVEDNRVTRTKFRLLLEAVVPGCAVNNAVVPTPSLTAHLALQSMLHPLHKLTWRENTSPKLSLSYSPVSQVRSPDLDIHIVSLRSITTLPSPTGPGTSVNKSDQAVTGGLVLHRLLIDRCFPLPSNFHEPKICQPGDSCGRFLLSDLFPNHFGQWMQPASLSFLHTSPPQERNQPQPLCAMDMRAFLLSK